MAWAPDYITADELKAYQRINDTVDDAQIAFAIPAASRAVDSFCGRQFGSVASEPRTYVGTWYRARRAWVFEIDDLFDTDNMTVLAGTDEITDYTLEPLNALKKGRVYERLVSSVSEELTIDAPWGWPAAPVAVKQATLIQASRFLADRDSPYGVAGSPENGSELRLLDRVHPDVGVALRPYVRRWWAR